MIWIRAHCKCLAQTNSDVPKHLRQIVSLSGRGISTIPLTYYIEFEFLWVKKENIMLAQDNMWWKVTDSSMASESVGNDLNKVSLQFFLWHQLKVNKHTANNHTQTSTNQKKEYENEIKKMYHEVTLLRAKLDNMQMRQLQRDVFQERNTVSRGFAATVSKYDHSNSESLQAFARKDCPPSKNPWTFNVGILDKNKNSIWVKLKARGKTKGSRSHANGQWVLLV